MPQLAGFKPPSCGFDTACYGTYLQGFNSSTLIISIASLALLIFFGKPLSTLLKKAQVPSTLVTAISKCGPLLIVLLGTVAVTRFELQAGHGVTVVGKIPSGFPSLGFEFMPIENWTVLLPSATFIALIAYVETVAIAKVTDNFRGEKINPNQELIALGAANLITAASGGMAVAGGFSRTMVNFSAVALPKWQCLLPQQF